ncbi:hypothetical protein RHGRI_033227 [Rhododendron griersonianum]|uniref:Uncharacterized protein n=1 Tax=Rhododendron griersonianum TaxID=479676 RepID=A0AAV6HVU7_9ERIC|nr:hypothetical protein RHGRI_033227 [Rhododendron griersonianum]
MLLHRTILHLGRIKVVYGILQNWQKLLIFLSRYLQNIPNSTCTEVICLVDP